MQQHKITSFHSDAVLPYCQTSSLQPDAGLIYSVLLLTTHDDAIV